MALTWLDVTAMAPELSDVPVSAQDEILADVDDLPDDVWGACRSAGGNLGSSAQSTLATFQRLTYMARIHPPTLRLLTGSSSSDS
jgi:hypothetical protein